MARSLSAYPALATARTTACSRVTIWKLMKYAAPSAEPRALITSSGNTSSGSTVST